jgi:hypothetical protein
MTRGGPALLEEVGDGRTPVVLAAAGILVGLGLVLTGLLAPPLPGTEETEIVARVNGRPISSRKFDQLALGLNDERRAGGRPTLDRSEILERLIQEELFVGRAVELGLPYSDKIARGYLINSLLTMITDEAMTAVPSRPDLERFFRENLQRFTPARQVAAEFLFVAAPGEEGRARAEALRGGWEQAPGSGPAPSPDPMPFDIPRSLVPVQKLAEYLGSETAGKIARLAVGETTPAMPWMQGWVVARLTDRASGDPPAFEAVESQVLEAFRRRQAEEEYQRYMKEIRRTADIRIVGGGP